MDKIAKTIPKREHEFYGSDGLTRIYLMVVIESAHIR